MKRHFDLDEIAPAPCDAEPLSWLERIVLSFGILMLLSAIGSMVWLVLR